MGVLKSLLATVTLYWSDILVISVALIVLLLLYKKGKIAIVKSIVTTLVVKAEKELGTKTGIAKYNQVISQLYLSLPILVRLLFTETEFDTYIEEAVTWLKTVLADPDISLLSYSEEATAKATIAVPTTNSIPTIITIVPKYVTADGKELQPVTATSTSIPLGVDPTKI